MTSFSTSPLSPRMSAGRGFQNPPAVVVVRQAISQAVADAGLPRFPDGREDFEAVVGMNLLEDRGLRQFSSRVAENLLVIGAVVRKKAHVSRPWAWGASPLSERIPTVLRDKQTAEPYLSGVIVRD